MLFAPSGKGRKRQKKGEKGRLRPISRKGGQTALKPPFVTPPFAAVQSLEIFSLAWKPLVGACLATCDSIFATGSDSVSKTVLRSCGSFCLISGHTIMVWAGPGSPKPLALRAVLRSYLSPLFLLLGRDSGPVWRQDLAILSPDGPHDSTCQLHSKLRSLWRFPLKPFFSRLTFPRAKSWRQIFMTGRNSGRRIGRKIGRNFGDEIFWIFWAFPCFIGYAERPTKLSPQIPPNLSLHVLSRLLWLKSQNFISASLWGLGCPTFFEINLGILWSGIDNSWPLIAINSG